MRGVIGIGVTSRHTVVSTWHLDEQPSCESPAPSSHVSPAITSTTPLPHVSFELQIAEQPSPASTLPSSQASGGSVMRSPHTIAWQAPSPHAPVNALVVHPSWSALPLQAAICSGVAQLVAVHTSPAAQRWSPQSTVGSWIHPASSAT